MKEELEPTCPFCRKAIPKTEEANHKQWMKRIEANDPYAMCQIGMLRFMEGDYNGAFEYFTKAAALGDIEAHYQLSFWFIMGKAFRRMRKGHYNMQNRLQLEDNLMPGVISQLLRG